MKSLRSSLALATLLGSVFLAGIGFRSALGSQQEAALPGCPLAGGFTLVATVSALLTVGFS